MFNKMDWYYTNGLQFLLYYDGLQKSPFDRVLLPFKIREKNRAWYGLALRQELYTPWDRQHWVFMHRISFTGSHPPVRPKAGINRSAMM